MKLLILFTVLSVFLDFSDACTVTTASGTRAPAAGSFCSGALIFEDNFDTLDQGKWRHAGTMSGGGNEEFQWYVNDRFNSYVLGGNLHFRTSFTADIFGEDFLTSGRVIIPPEECTEVWNRGCDRTGTYDDIIKPTRSARVDTYDSFSFKYGTIEFRAKMPAGKIYSFRLISLEF